MTTFANNDLDWEVLIPAFQAESTISRAIASAARQAHPPKAIRVFDDGSTDSTAERALEAGRRCSVPVIVTRDDRNRGVGVARQKLLSNVTSEWFLILDADDELLPFASGELTRALTENPGADLHSFAEVGYSQAHSVRRPAVWRYRRVEFTEIWKRNTIVSSGSLIRTTSALKAGGFPPTRRLVDYSLWLRMFQNPDCVGFVYSSPVVARAIGGTTITGNVTAALEEQRRLIEAFAAKAYGGSGVTRAQWFLRNFDMWWRGYKRYAKYGRDPASFDPLTKYVPGMGAALVDRLLRSRAIAAPLSGAARIRARRHT